MASASSVFAIFYDANAFGFQGSPYRERRRAPELDQRCAVARRGRVTLNLSIRAEITHFAQDEVSQCMTGARYPTHRGRLRHAHKRIGVISGRDV
jgi:hypothetical protein